MKKQIVVSIDPMNIKQNVIDYAEELARIGHMELLIYSVQGMPLLSQADGALTSPGIEYVPGVVEEVERFTTALFEKVKQRYPLTRLEQGLGFQTSSTIGKMEEMEGSESGSCMLVMPKTSDHGWWDNMVGTTETAVAAEVSCPVLFVPEGVEFRGITRIMYLADAQSLSDGRYKGFRFLKTFAEMHSAQVVVGFIFDPENSGLNQTKLGEAMDAFKASLPLQFTHEYRFFLHNSFEEILQMAGITHTDIVAFPFRESSVLERFFDHEITRMLVLKADMPVLVF
ncbi:MAG: universal stress protein [Saprospiraceae bacterium]|nr:universal stress protein [Saprospiraceae bacterium]